LGRSYNPQTIRLSAGQVWFRNRRAATAAKDHIKYVLLHEFRVSEGGGTDFLRCPLDLIQEAMGL
jgi:hypothetical protein